MDKIKGKKFIQILFSVIVAVAVWIYVDTTLVTNTTMKLKGLPIEFSGEETTLADRGFMLLSGYDTTIDLVLEGPRSSLYELDAENVRLVADTDSITAVGTQSLRYTVEYPDSIQRNSVTVKSASAYSVTVSVGELYTKEVPVYCEVIGDVASGYFKGDVSIDVNTLVLHAQREDLLNVEYAKVEVSASGAHETIIQTLNYTLYDYNDIPVYNDSIRSATKVIQITLPVRTKKVVPLTIDLIGTGGVLPEKMEYVVEPQTVTLIGEGATLETINSILLDRIYVEDLEPYQTFTYEIKAPIGTTIEGNETTALVTISIEGVIERTLEVGNITCINVPDGYRATAADSISVTVWGIEQDVEKLDSSSIQISADLTDITGEGTYVVPVKIIINGIEGVTTKGEYEVSVTVTKRSSDGGSDSGHESA